VPLKIQAFAWKALKDRIPSKMNLVHKNLLLDAKLLCSACDSVVKSTIHIFFERPMSAPLWRDFLALWGVQSLLHSLISTQFMQWQVLVNEHRKQTFYGKLYGLLKI